MTRNGDRRDVLQAGRRRSSGPITILDAPEANIAFFGFLLHHPWEFLQVPLFQGMENARLWDAILVCTQATLGDAVILLIAYAGVSFAARTRRWVLAPSWGQVAAYVVTGVIITIILEWINTGPLDRWSYAPAMPVLPVLEVGLSPLAQWILLPPLVLWIVRRQLT